MEEQDILLGSGEIVEEQDILSGSGEIVQEEHKNCSFNSIFCVYPETCEPSSEVLDGFTCSCRRGYEGNGIEKTHPGGTGCYLRK